MRGHWHILAHVFNTLPCGDGDPSKVTASCNYISGHLFSRDGLSNWTVAREEPYSFKIQYSDGSSGLVATRERPKLLFDEVTGEPTHLFTSAADLPHTACAQCGQTQHHSVGACIDCKITAPFDTGVYTMVRPLRIK
jgi:hypothetical protein